MSEPTRWEQLSALMSAMIAVIVSGNTDSLLDANTPTANIERLAGHYFMLPDDLRRKFRGGQIYFGQLTQIAKTLDVSPAVVANVFRGKAKSKRIGAAILSRICELEGPRFLERVQTVQTPYKSAFSPAERQQFKRRGKYYGTIARVARDLGVTADTVSYVIRGESASASIVDRMRSEMAYVDKNPPRLSKAKPFSEEIRAQFNRGGIYFRVYAKVAHSLGIKPATVSAVARGTYRSQRVLAALHVEMAQIDASLTPALTKPELREFARGGKYFGAFSRIGRTLRKCPTTVRNTALGMNCSPDVLSAIRAEMALVDASLASKTGGHA